MLARANECPLLAQSGQWVVQSRRHLAAEPPCVRPQLADTDPAHSRPLPADPAASAATYAYAPASAASAASAASDDCTASTGSCCAGSTGSCCAASTGSCSAAASATSGNFFDEFGCSETFLVEDIERRQSDVRNFLLFERNYGKRCVVLRRYVRYRNSC